MPAPFRRRSISPALVDAARRSKAWPFEEAQKVIARTERRGGPAGEVVFETGYGPSGLPHIGTFGEVARTTMVRTAFRLLTEDKVPTRLICFSDDMDGLRKVPDNVPNKEMMRAHLNQPLTKVPDPFGEYRELRRRQQCAAQEIPRPLRLRLRVHERDRELPRRPGFDATLLKMLAAYDEVMAIMLPSLREERQQTYSPFLPVSPTTGAVLQVPILERNVAAGTIVYRDPDSERWSRCRSPAAM